MTSKTTLPILAAAAGLRFEVVQITPSVATEWLERNFERNRTINKTAVERYAAEMKAGRWRVTHQGLAFDEHGRLIDGQHRLRAVKAAQVSVPMLVAYYVDASPLAAIDRGTGRTLGNVLEIEGAVGKGRGASVSAICGMIYSLTTGSKIGGLTPDLVKRVYDAHRDGVGFAVQLSRSKRLIASFGAVAAYTYPISPHRIDSLFTQAKDGEGLTKFSGAWHLHNLFNQPRIANSHDGRLLAARSALKCVQLHLEDREAKLLKVSVDGVVSGLTWAQRERQKLGLTILAVETR